MKPDQVGARVCCGATEACYVLSTPCATVVHVVCVCVCEQKIAINNSKHTTIPKPLTQQ